MGPHLLTSSHLSLITLTCIHHHTIRHHPSNLSPHHLIPHHTSPHHTYSHISLIPSSLIPSSHLSPHHTYPLITLIPTSHLSPHHTYPLITLIPHHTYPLIHMHIFTCTQVHVHTCVLLTDMPCNVPPSHTVTYSFPCHVAPCSLPAGVHIYLSSLRTPVLSTCTCTQSLHSQTFPPPLSHPITTSHTCV